MTSLRKTLIPVLLTTAFLVSCPVQAIAVAWEVLETPTMYGNPPDEDWYDVQLTVRNLGLEGSITAFAVAVSDGNVWAYTSRPGWQPHMEQGVHHAETWDTDYSQLFAGMSWDQFMGGQTRADGSNYSWFALYYLDPDLTGGNGIGVGTSSSQFSYTTDFFPASPAALAVVDDQGNLAAYAGSTTLVPEAETWTLLLAGLGLLGLRLRRHDE